MKKINNNGFALVETLIVTSFVIGIFTVMYSNFYPMMGEYEKREQYNDISALYNTNLLKKMIERNKSSLSEEITSIRNGTNDYIKLNEYYFSDESEYFTNITEKLLVDAIYLLPYNIENFKNNNSYSSSFDVLTRDYINYLPNFTKNPYNLNCRIIVKYKSNENKESSLSFKDYKFSTIGVDC